MFTVNIYHQKADSKHPPFNLGTPPPSYQATEGTSAQPVYVPVPVVVHPAPRRHWAPLRFVKAFVIAVFVWSVIGIIARGIIECARWRHRHGRFPWPIDSPIPHDITTDCSSQWEDLPVDPSRPFLHRASKSFVLPYTAANLFFLSRGIANGLVIFRASGDLRDDIRVNVTTTYRDYNIRDRGEVCLTWRKDGARGVGIFAQSRIDHPSEDGISFVTTITLPTHPDGSPLLINHLEADMPFHSFIFTEFAEAVPFRKITLTSREAEIKAEGLTAESVLVRTSNAPITGSFNATTSLILTTSNAPITVDVGLQNNNIYPSILSMKTSNGMIRSSVSLLRDHNSSFGGKYDVTATTSNHPLELDFPASPVDSALTLKATTSNGYANVALNPAFEGEFWLRTSNVMPEVDEREVEDPTGRGRERETSIKYVNRWIIGGEVIWKARKGVVGRGQSAVNVMTSNAKVLLRL